jgi:hypothetical protein
MLGIMQTAQLLGFELDDSLDHIDWLDHAGGKHARNSSNPEGLNEINNARVCGFLWRR